MRQLDLDFDSLIFHEQVGEVRFYFFLFFCASCLLSLFLRVLMVEFIEVNGMDFLLLLNELIQILFMSNKVLLGKYLVLCMYIFVYFFLFLFIFILSSLRHPSCIQFYGLAYPR